MLLANKFSLETSVVILEPSLRNPCWWGMFAGLGHRRTCHVHYQVVATMLAAIIKRWAEILKHNFAIIQWTLWANCRSNFLNSNSGFIWAVCRNELMSSSQASLYLLHTLTRLTAIRSYDTLLKLSARLVSVYQRRSSWSVLSKSNLGNCSAVNGEGW